MSSQCKDECRNDTSSQLKIGYKNGQRYCKTCMHYWNNLEDLRCPCCQNKLRTKPKYNKETKKKTQNDFHRPL